MVDLPYSVVLQPPKGFPLNSGSTTTLAAIVIGLSLKRRTKVLGIDVDSHVIETNWQKSVSRDALIFEAVWSKWLTHNGSSGLFCTDARGVSVPRPYSVVRCMEPYHGAFFDSCLKQAIKLMILSFPSIDIAVSSENAVPTFVQSC